MMTYPAFKDFVIKYDEQGKALTYFSFDLEMYNRKGKLYTSFDFGIAISNHVKYSKDFMELVHCFMKDICRALNKLPASNTMPIAKSIIVERSSILLERVFLIESNWSNKRIHPYFILGDGGLDFKKLKFFEKCQKINWEEGRAYTFNDEFLSDLIKDFEKMNRVIGLLENIGIERREISRKEFEKSLLEGEQIENYLLYFKFLKKFFVYREIEDGNLIFVALNGKNQVLLGNYLDG